MKNAKATDITLESKRHSFLDYRFPGKKKINSPSLERKWEVESFDKKPWCWNFSVSMIKRKKEDTMQSKRREN